MKLKKLLLNSALIAGLSTALISCSKNDSGPEETKVETGASGTYSIFLVDTNRIRSANNDGTNVKLITTVTQSSSKSVYISAMSANPERTKIAYMVRKGNFPAYSTELRIVDFSGSNDKLLIAINDNSAMPGNVKFGSGGVVYYNYFLGTSTKFYSIKDDGTANTLKISHQFEDLSNDGRYLLRYGFSLDPTVTPIQVLDLSGDGGGGSNKFSKNLTFAMPSMKISSDGTKAAGIFRSGTTVKLLLADINANTTTEKTLGTSSDAFGSLFISFATDNKTLICTIGSSTSSKTYIYSIEAGTSTSFTNINKDVMQVYGF